MGKNNKSTFQTYLKMLDKHYGNYVINDEN